MRYGSLSIVVLVAGLLPALAHADSETDRLREALRSATAQTRALEDQRTGLQAKLAEADREKANLKAQVDAAKARAAQVEKEYRQAVQDFNARLEERNQTLEKWKDAYEEASTVARTKDAERAKFEAESKAYLASTKACTTKNGALVKVGRELLDRYANVTIGDMMVAREPVFALRRVEIQNLLQDYRDKVLEQQVQQEPALSSSKQ
jgi:chromosome segregation ATPase